MNNLYDDSDTIAAISTPIGEGGIGIVRISGDQSLDLLSKIFEPANKDIKKNNKDQLLIPSRILTYGKIYDKKRNLIDEVLVSYMKSPTTYTGEETVEINCHGGIIPLRNILNTVVSLGARPAERGEFTKRAFLNGKLDLTQAEAVMDLISAKTDTSFNVAMTQLQGRLSEHIRLIRSYFIDLLVQITVNIDYPDEDIEELTYSNILESLHKIDSSLKELSASSERGRILREGLRIAIVGKPNVGKSSILNALLYEDRAIVTDVPGTTRDIIEETIDVRGIPVVITDTAGIRDTDDLVEKIGVEKSKLSIESSDLIFFVLDAARIIDEEDERIFSHIRDKNHIILINKNDVDNKAISSNEVKEHFGEDATEISAIRDGSIQEIETLIEEFVNSKSSGFAASQNFMITNARHKKLIDDSILAVSDAITSTEAFEPLEILEIDVNHAYELLGEIIGETTAGDIIDKVFERFCLGK
ncbi:MAG: tRNA uridine-5-carboxymethylaminomethyl(34) synthesis GTPase MnmE [Clostridiales bacterium]|nr:tRNA uridine-5-carboxymethylaminomethyl(34) synthesis GTPase MnmE [Clostridiales bacterium]MDY6116560.1 tRNA uridine-5-carboxymethylaminomethyl(34) synthesis GTPase MnmE [Anaerovoracaceae bacterium]